MNLMIFISLSDISHMTLPGYAAGPCAATIQRCDALVSEESGGLRPRRQPERRVMSGCRAQGRRSHRDRP